MARQIWIVPRGREALGRLRLAFGVERVEVRRASSDDPRPEKEVPEPDLLERTRDALTLSGYSPRTRKVYLGHLRRFLAWCDHSACSNDPAEQAQAYLLELIRKRRISKSYQNQVVSALRFLAESVLGQPRLALAIPRPRKEHRLPAVLSAAEVARMLKGARNLKHRALLMLVYSAGLRGVRSCD